jgi:hypothetical protein
LIPAFSLDLVQIRTLETGFLKSGSMEYYVFMCENGTMRPFETMGDKE